VFDNVGVDDDWVVAGRVTAADCDVDARGSRVGAGRVDSTRRAEDVLAESTDVVVGFAVVSPTTASVSRTGAEGADVAAAGAGVADCADAGVGTVFWRLARYPPPAAAAMHATASAANASRFDIETSL
jgi:hypothetical protein